MTAISSLCLIFAACFTIVAGFDLGPSMRIAQCRSLCLRRHDEAKECKDTPSCYTCWETCGLLENDWTIWGSVCQDDEEICFAGCKTACAYHATRVEEQFLPSTLPAPLPGPVYLQAYDVGILFRKIDEDWEETNQYHGERVMALNRTSWVVVVAENGVRQYSGEFWKPDLENLKEGTFFEASLSWSGFADGSEEREIDADIADLNSKMTLDFENEEILENALMKSGVGIEETTTLGYAKIKATPSTRRSSNFATDSKGYFDEQNARILSDVNRDGEGHDDELAKVLVAVSKNVGKEKSREDERGFRKSISPSYIVSWEPEAGGLMGNQVTDARSTQISLIPGTKYLVRVASNEGPGSFALEIDTSIKTVQFAPLEAVAASFQPWAILAGSVTALTFVAIMILAKVCGRRTTPDDKLDYV